MKKQVSVAKLAAAFIAVRSTGPPPTIKTGTAFMPPPWEVNSRSLRFKDRTRGVGSIPDAARLLDWVLCHEAQPVQTAARNFIGDEGRSFGFGDQVADPKPPRAALVKSHGGERCGNVGTMIPAGKVDGGERKRTVDEVSKAD
jgi:hypothetical protein